MGKDTGRLSCNHESAFHDNRVSEEGISPNNKTDSLLHGAHVDVSVGDSIQQCIVESGYVEPNSFCARSARSCIVHCWFTRATAKELHEKGFALNMKLVK